MSNRQRAPDGQLYPIFFKRFDTLNMVIIARGLKFTRQVLLNLVESGPRTRPIGPTSGHISIHQLHVLYVERMMPTTKLIKN